MVLLYDKNSMNLIEEKIDDIIFEARKYALENVLEPSLDEYKQVMKIILDFITINRRIIYGGYGWNELIIRKKPEDRIYSIDKIEQPDIEFYSFKPIHDLVFLCNELNEKGFKFVRAESAQHHETYSIFVNQLGYCDITYMPKFLFDKMPIIKVNNLNISHPKFILIDIMRQYNDPMTSYWRLKKNLLRANTLLTHYPLETRGKFTKFKIDDSTQRILDFIRKNVIIGSKLLVFGYYAYNYYKFKGNDKKEELYVPYYDVISTNLIEDVVKIKETLQNYESSILIEEYHKFFQFLDNRISFKFNNRIVLNIYGNNEMCIPYYFVEKKKINIVTFPYMVQTLLIKHIYYHINNNKLESHNFDYLLEDIIKIRNNYLKKNKKTILDDTPFQEFRIKCMGKTIEPSRRFRLSVAEKLMKKERIKFRYDPNVDKNLNPDKMIFDNTSGNINNSKNKIFK
jgi:hypothetical protein